ncbi:hypothetical protein F7725_002426 [Dissostichus mawsoni]|uniref:NADH dehydrogenase subunit 4 n=1 Tax=Dissostichus mawsoni TaxID=36200 RepID=A0A7J5Y4K2_DISMA|nr:hypothetical protein F7725_002426 [Dissostichus mawsoni]
MFMPVLLMLAVDVLLLETFSEHLAGIGDTPHAHEPLALMPMSLKFLYSPGLMYIILPLNWGCSYISQ